MNIETEERLTQLAEDYVSQIKKGKLLSRLIKIAILLLIVIWIVKAGLSFFNTIPEISGGYKPASTKHVGVINFSGVIAADQLNGELSAVQINGLMEEILENQNSLGVILKMNSPGGSPVQSELIFNKIRELKQKYPKKKIISVVEEICTSGCFFVAAGTDKIYSSESSVIGSIGVRLDYFGLQGLMEKIGVEPRTLNAGENKLLLDPFQDMSDEQKQHIQNEILDVIHDVFIDAVKLGRGDRLQDDPEIFSGQIWLGYSSVVKGLIDDIASIDDVAENEFNNADLQVYKPKLDFLERLERFRIGDLSKIISQIKALLNTEINVKT